MKKRAEATARRAEVAEVIPAAVVRDLVDSNERTIEQLRQELAKELREAEEAELRVAVLSGDAGSVPRRWCPGPGRQVARYRRRTRRQFRRRTRRTRR